MYVLVNREDVTEEMESVTTMQKWCIDGSKCLMSWKANTPKPSCYDSYDSLSQEQVFQELNREGVWNPPLGIDISEYL